MKPVVCDGATMQCVAGTAPSMLTVTNNMFYTINNMKAATIMDFATGVNVKPFGTCNILTAAASGVPTPCAPALTSWATTPSMNQTCTMIPILTMPATSVCAVGGMVSVTNPNDTIETST